MGLLDSLSGGGKEPDDPEAERLRAQDVERVESGSIPLAAERRMRELAAGATGFTSGLSVADFALCREAGVRPVAPGEGQLRLPGRLAELPVDRRLAAERHRLRARHDLRGVEPRARALRRLAEEAELA